MEKKIINILGKDVKIAFNMATQICFEEITGQAFTQSALDKTSNTLALYYACILANNPDIDITFDNLLEDASAADIKALREAVLDSFTEWCRPVVGEDAQPAKEGENQKN